MPDKPKYILEQMELGPMQNYSYFVGDAVTKEVAIVDPGWDVEAIVKNAKNNSFSIVAVFLTHGHYDHIDALPDLLNVYDVPVYISESEIDIYRPQVKNLKNIRDVEVIKIGEIEIRCIHTPGHSPGGMCFYFEGCLITGDTLFLDACGRVDLPGGDMNALINSLRNKICILPDETIIYPGHRYHTLESDTLGNQKKTNPYLSL